MDASTTNIELKFGDLQRVQTLWFSDGNLLIQVGATLYRLYQGILSRQSTYFRQMLAPGKIEKLPLVYGCRFIGLDDNVEDATPFFSALFDSSFFEAPPTSTSFTLISSILRLSLKYRVPSLIQRSISHFDTTFPLILAGWRKREKLRTIPPISHTPFAILSRSSEFPIPWILPALYYCLCTFPLSSTLEGVEFEGAHIDLHWSQIKTCLAGRSKLLSLQSRYVVQFTSQGDSSASQARCQDPDFCKEVRKDALTEILNWETIGFLDLVLDHPDLYDQLCDECHQECMVFFERTTAEMWDRLPEVFGLGSWKELEEKKLAVIR